MSRRVAILTPDPEDEGYRSRWREVFARTAAPLEEAGLTVEGRSWVDAQDLPDFDLVMPLLVWGYHRAGAAWQAAVAGWEAKGVRLANSAPVLRWNADKLYLGTLTQRGAPVVPTIYDDRCTLELLETAAAEFRTERLIAKPQISASAWQTVRWSSGDTLDGAPTGPTLVQPYLPSIETDGEISLIYLGGRFSHAIRKLPQPGDFRVQPEYDGIITPHAPAPDELEAAQAILSAVEENLLYARIDLVRDLEGRPALMELELVEPDLYLGFDPAAPGRFAQAVSSYLT